MNLKLLIDGLVRQTTVLIAQVSTTAGVRSPLSHVADQVFLQLSKELESQGVSRAVAADMFGMALRTYQRKIQRVTESASAQGVTLWEAVYEFVKQESPTRQRLLERFRNDGEREVASVLHDLVSNGLVYATGSGPYTSYGPTSEHMQNQILGAADLEALVHVVWLRIFQGLGDVAQLADATGVDQERVEVAIRQLEHDGQVTRVEGELHAKNLQIPVGATTGMEAAMLDHFRAVCHLLVARSCASIDKRTTSSLDSRAPAFEDGGSTFGFSVCKGHPFEAEVAELLHETRSKTQTLWNRVAAYNEQHPRKPAMRKVTFYCGQVTIPEDEESVEPKTSDGS